MWLLFVTLISMTQQYVVFVSSDSFVLYIYQFENGFSQCGRDIMFSKNVVLFCQF